MKLAVVLFTLLLISPAPAAAVELGYRCPAVFTDDDGTLRTLAPRTTGAWRVDEPLPFVLGSGRYWRFVCAYVAPGIPEVGAVLHWVEVPDADGRALIAGTCGDPTPADGGEVSVASPTYQAEVRIDAPSNTARGQLARDLLAAAEAVAAYCPGEEPPVCARWQLDIRLDEGTNRCIWEIRPQSDGFFLSYNLRCESGRGGMPATMRFRVWQIGTGLYRLESHPTADGSIFVYRGDFAQDLFEGAVGWRTPGGRMFNDLPFTARCLERHPLEVVSPR